MSKVLSKQAKSIYIVAGGDIDPSFIPDIQKAKFVMGVDRGALWLISHGVRPAIAIGDFDSVNAAEQARIRSRSKKVSAFSPKKDKTDLELAIETAIGMQPNEVTIYGALGTRFDHSLGAVHMLSKLESHNICGYIVDRNNIIYIVRRQKEISRYALYPYVSILPLTTSSNVSLHGFVYDIARVTLRSGSTLGISNEILGKTAVVQVHRGPVLVIHSRDGLLGKETHS